MLRRFATSWSAGCALSVCTAAASAATIPLLYSATAFKSDAVKRMIAERAIMRNMRLKMARGEDVPMWMRLKVMREEGVKLERQAAEDPSQVGGGFEGVGEGKKKRARRFQRGPQYLRVEDVQAANAAFGVKQEELPAPSARQKEIVDFVVGDEHRRSVFITGGAGTGKSVLLRHIIAACSATPQQRSALRVAAPTGVAAMNVGGLTLHSLMGIFPGDEENPDTVERRIRKRIMLQRAMADARDSSNGAAGTPQPLLERLVIDEVSMVSPRMFEATKIFCRMNGPRCELPWGGVQLIVCGDFLQLPPVARPSMMSAERSTRSVLSDLAAGSAQPLLPPSTNKSGGDVKYCFQTAAWTEAMLTRFDLTEPFRQHSDAAFLSFLNDARVGKVHHTFLLTTLTPEAKRKQREQQQHQQLLLQQQLQKEREQAAKSTTNAKAKGKGKRGKKTETVGAAADKDVTTTAAPAAAPPVATQVPAAAAVDEYGDDGLVRIRATNTEVDAINMMRFEALTEQNRRVEAEMVQWHGADAFTHCEMHKRPAFATTFIAHCTGKLARGTGASPLAAPAPKTEAERQQLIAVAAAAAAGFESNSGGSLRDTSVVERLELQRGTRVVLLRNLDVSCGLVNGRLGTVVDFQRVPETLLTGLGGSSGGKRRNKVSKKEEGAVTTTTTTAGQLSPTILTVAPAGVLPIVDFDGVGPVLVMPYMWSLTAGDEVIGTATQLPLRQAWAITSHRSQGLTLDKVEVDLRRFFDTGQGYVALSRARRADGLTVLNASAASRGAIKACPVALDFQLPKTDTK